MAMSHELPTRLTTACYVMVVGDGQTYMHLQTLALLTPTIILPRTQVLIELALALALALVLALYYLREPSRQISPF